MENDWLALSAQASVVLGKVMVAIGLTPSITKSEKNVDFLTFHGSVLQFTGFTIEAEISRDEYYQFGTRLKAFGYIMIIYSFITCQDSYSKLRFSEFNSLDQVLASVVILSDRSTWEENYLLIGNFMALIGNFLISFGRAERMRSPAPLDYIDPLETKGAWITALGTTIILLGEVEKRTAPQKNPDQRADDSKGRRRRSRKRNSTTTICSQG